MKIAYLSNSPITTTVANAVHVMNMCAALAENGHQVILHAQGSKRKCTNVYERFGVSSTFRIVVKAELQLRLLGRLIYGLQQALTARYHTRPDLCYARCLISAYFSLHLGMKVVLELHDMPTSLPMTFLYNRLLAHENLKRVVVISKELLADLESKFSQVTQKDPLVAHDAANLPTATKSFNSSSSKNTICVGYAGGLKTGNGIATIIDLAESFPELVFHIAGGQEHELLAWKRLQRSLNIHWHGILEPSAIPAFLSSCDILIAPYQHGPKTARGHDTSKWMSPLKIFEYMAAAKPIVASDYPVLREVLDSDIAILVHPNILNDWRNAIARLVKNDLERTTLGQRAYRRLRNNFTWKKRAKLVLSGLNG